MNRLDVFSQLCHVLDPDIAVSSSSEKKEASLAFSWATSSVVSCVDTMLSITSKRVRFSVPVLTFLILSSHSVCAANRSSSSGNIFAYSLSMFSITCSNAFRASVASAEAIVII